MASNSQVVDSAPFSSSAANLESMVAWSIEVGQKVARQEVMDAYGATIQGGIQASRKTPNIMLYTDLTLAEKYGYTFDGWSPTEDGVFYYSGQGPRGDQSFTSGNKAILDHQEEGLLHV